MSFASREETSPSHGIQLQHSTAALKYETLTKFPYYFLPCSPSAETMAQRIAG